ncbi:MAG TPA: Fe-S oxidoreductase [Dehalococcoidia bacterium]|nr:Fe-S oxidoreductase [Chloroflexota bacterium]MQF95507.1 (Fe-S)-binding protein [SAR202 cluster bacterium]HAA94995.1 Fe-S oxidoreductase [Dehalococcoidia bacterium]HCL26468.1 Fe-S oxidoreductase [Dehalococcoidia bacterium]
MTQKANADLFVTCIIDQLYPEVGVSVVKVLRRLGVNVGFPKDQSCCGQPLYNTGFTQESRKLATRVLEQFKDSDYVVVPSGSCAATIRVFYLELFADVPSLLSQAKALAAKTYEFSEFLVDVLGVDDATACGASQQGSAAYHPSCHLLRELGVREGPAKLLDSVPGLEREELAGAEECCGFGGTFSVKFPHISEEMVADKIANVQASGADTLVACDMSCLMNMGGALNRQGSDVKIRHLAQILDSDSD